VDADNKRCKLFERIELGIDRLFTSPQPVAKHLNITDANRHLFKLNTDIDPRKGISMLVSRAFLSLLPDNHWFVGLLREVPQLIAHSPANPEACAIDLAQHIFKRLYETSQAVPQVTPPDTVPLLPLMVEVYLAVLDMLNLTLKDQLTKVLLDWVDENTGPNRFNVDVASGLLRHQLVDIAAFDSMLAGWIRTQPGDPLSAMNLPALNFAEMLLRRICLEQHGCSREHFVWTLKAMHNVVGHSRGVHYASMSPREMQPLKSIAKVLEELRVKDKEPQEDEDLKDYVAAFAGFAAGLGR